MLKRTLTLIIALILISTMSAGCGSKASIASEAAKADMAVAAEAKGGESATAAQFSSQDEYENTGASPKEEPKAENGLKKENGSAIIRSGSNTQTVSNPILAQRKIIRNANISVEVADFDKSYVSIKSMINTYGFIQESSVKKQKDYKGNPITSGIIVVRVDKDKFDEMLTGIKGLGDLIDENIKSDDVTDKFFDTESRLRLLRFEESRLEEYLKKINDPDIIFKTESRLTDIRHEIESLTGTLNKWNDLVALSTITINLYEKSTTIDNIPVVKSYSNRLSESFYKSIDGVVGFFGELLIFLVAAFPILIVIGIIVWAVFAIYRRINKGRNYKTRVEIDNKHDIGK